MSEIDMNAKCLFCGKKSIYKQQIRNRTIYYCQDPWCQEQFDDYRDNIPKTSIPKHNRSNTIVDISPFLSK